MSAKSRHVFPALHNAMWPGLVGKGLGSEPAIDLDTMLRLTAAAALHDIKFDGVDLFLSSPHVDIDSSDSELERIAGKIASFGLMVGSLVAPVWASTGGGSAMGGDHERMRFLVQVRKACRIGQRLRDFGVRRYGVIRIDSADSPAEWAKDPVANTKRIADTFRQACDIAEEHVERLAAEGEICWGGLHSWRRVVQLLELVDRPETLGFQADMAHTLLFMLGYNAPEDRLLPDGFDWSNSDQFQASLRTMAGALRPWTVDFHVAQNDATVKGMGSHDKTGHHCLPNDPNGKLNIVRDSGYWMTDDADRPTRAFQHICWDGCMFPNSVMLDQKTWNDILAVMVAVRDQHGWD